MLWLIATPIGNLGDLPPRAAEVLRSADALYAEDTRVTRRLLSYLDIHGVRLARFDDATGARKIPEILRLLAEGRSVALVSDAGTPTISDPGMPLVAAARQVGFEVSAVPGPCAAVMALSISGLPAHAYFFGGFLPRKAGKRKALLESLASLPATLIFYESPYRVAATLAEMAELFPGRTGAFARELTKKFEEVRGGGLADLAAELNERAQRGAVKGEFVILVAPPQKAAAARDDES